MNSWVEVFTAARDWLTGIWNGIFSIEIFDGLTFKVLILGVLMVSFSISLYRFFVSNTHAELGTYTEVYNMDNGKTTRTITRRHRGRM